MAPDRQAGAELLYLSYDGMCDPLGGSQVLPYLFGLARLGHRITLISFEKRERSAEERDSVRKACTAAAIDWRPLPYHKRPPVASTLYDIRRMRDLAFRLHRQKRFDIVHCRSYVPAIVGLRLKRRRGVRFIFDMRGFWPDERVEGGVWRLSNPLYRQVYRHFKRREGQFLAEADQVISLTEAGCEILAAGPSGPPITLIPCCTDFEAFPAVTPDSRRAARALLGIPDNARVAAYLGSIGTWYLLDEMLDFFRAQLDRDPDALFLIISRDRPNEILAAAQRRGLPADRLLVRPASRAEVPRFVAAADYGLFFIMPVFSKKASSPTKMGEFLALELPMVTNGGVGDVERIMEETGAGVVVSGFNADAYREALDQLEQVRPDMDRWRAASRRWLDLQSGVERYDAIYRSLANAPVGSRGSIG
jgi:glycosyltransferase involved in cell wall biosynthesis